MKSITSFIAILAVATGLAAGPAWAGDAQYDIAIIGGRVIDPETGLDAIRNVGIKGSQIALVTEAAITGAKQIDASGQVVSPGFIDMHAHGQSIITNRMQALDGVTTALELEAGVMPVQDYYDRLAEEGRPINYGAAVNWISGRIAVIMKDKPRDDIQWFLAHFAHPEWQEQIATSDQLKAIEAYVAEGLDQGGLGVGMLVGYAPRLGRKEYYAVTDLAAKRGMPTFTHTRFLSMIEPDSSFEGMAEVIYSAAGTGAHTHIVHMNSISLRDVDLIGQMIAGAQAQGLPVSTEAYPYGAGSTGIGAALFRGDRWRERVGGVTAHNFDVGGHRLNDEELAYYQKEKPGTEAVIHFLDLDDPKDQAVLDKSVLFPGGVIASDGGDWLVDGEIVEQHVWPVPEKAWSHPRSAGTFSRFLRLYMREKKAVSLIEAIRRVSYGPAHILEYAVPQMKKKGRLQAGADADIVIFDPETVTDNATYEKPAQASSGFSEVIVNGVVLVDGGVMKTDILPGKAVRNAVKGAE